MYSRSGWVWPCIGVVDAWLCACIYMCVVCMQGLLILKLCIVETLTLSNECIEIYFYTFILLSFSPISFSGNSLSQVDPSQIVKNMSLATSPVEVDVLFQIKVLVKFVLIQMCLFLPFKQKVCVYS